MADWHQACCRKRPLRASRAPANRATPMAISRARTKSAARGAAVSKNSSLNRLSPCRLPIAVAQWTKFILPVRREVLRSHIGVGQEHHLFGSAGENTQSHERDGCTVFRRNCSASVRVCRGVTSNGRARSKFSKRLAPL